MKYTKHQFILFSGFWGVMLSRSKTDFAQSSIN